MKVSLTLIISGRGASAVSVNCVMRAATPASKPPKNIQKATIVAVRMIALPRLLNPCFLHVLVNVEEKGSTCKIYVKTKMVRASR